MKHDRLAAKNLRSPFLRAVQSISKPSDTYPYNIPAFSRGIDFEFTKPVTFFVGENGSGKSTLLEALAFNCGFNLEGGNRDHRFQTTQEVPALAKAIKLSWLPKVTDGFFMRAESLFNLASYLDAINSNQRRSFHGQSHGESFLSLFVDRFDRGLYILDEPEAALSPQRQLSFMKVIHDVVKGGGSQFIVATHSPILLTYPGADVLSLDGSSIEKVDYRDTQHFRLTKDFLGNPDAFLRRLFSDD